MKLVSFKLPLSCADLAGDLIGSVRGGPRDASTNKRYVEEAILADYFKTKRVRRAKKRVVDAAVLTTYATQGRHRSATAPAGRLTGIKSPRELVQRGLQVLVQLKMQERIRRYRGKLRSSEVEIGVEEARSRAKRLIKGNKNVFRRLA